MTDLEEDDSRQDCAQEPDMTTFYRVVAGFGNHVRNHPEPIVALDEIIIQFRPRRKKEFDWLVEAHDVLITSWVRYSPEIQDALKNPVPRGDRMMLCYRDTIEYALSRGEWPDGCARPYNSARR